MLLKEGLFNFGREARHRIQKLLFLSCVLFCKFSLAQPPAPNCKISNGYTRDGQAIRFVPATTIDSTADAKCILGIQVNATYSYITLIILNKAGIPKIENDLVIQFADQSSLTVPLTSSEEVNLQGMTGYTCSFVVLDKYVQPLKTRNISSVIIQLSESAFKTVDMKLKPAFLKDAVNCLGLISY